MSKSLPCFRKISKIFQLLRDFLLENGDLRAIFDDGADGFIPQSRHLFNLLPVPDRKNASRKAVFWWGNQHARNLQGLQSGLNAGTAGKRCCPGLTEVPLEARNFGVAYKGISLCDLW
jgi:hypothetical protein